MKIAIFSDIHGNIHALEAVLRHARGHGAAHMILTLGDCVGYGPEPEAVLRTIMGSGFINILGDYDRKVLSKEHRQEGWKTVKTADKRAMFAWTYQALSKRSKQYLKDLPEQQNLVIDGLRVCMSHGSPVSVDEHLGPDTRRGLRHSGESQRESVCGPLRSMDVAS